MDVPDEGDDQTRALERPLLDMTTIANSAPSDPGDRPAPDGESESDPGAGTDLPGGFEAIDAIRAHEPPRAGQVFFGRYLVERQIGEGGMGTVWLVRHLELDAPRALKLIVSGSAFDPNMRSRFRREARAMARLTHPNAVTVHDARIGHEAAFIEMEYVRGHSLNKLLSPDALMPLDWVGRILEQLCDVLQEAHERKIVHRDLKPTNLMLLADRLPGKEHLKVLDFGIAKILEAETESLDVDTGTGCFLGSAPWSSPEQVTGSEVDGRSDLYSVGIILYEILTGSRPFQGPLVRQVYDHLHSTPPRFSSINPRVSVPQSVEQVVLRCLAKNPDDRPQTARDLAAEFLWAISDERGTSSFVDSSPPRSSVDSSQTRDVFGTPGPDAPVRPSWRASALEPTELPGAHDANEPQTAPMDEHIAWDATGVNTATVDAGPVRGGRPAPKADVDPDGLESPGRPRRLLRLALAFLAACLVVVGVLAVRRLRSGPQAPVGYAAEGRVDGDPWPATLVRLSDKARFARIAGDEFTMGNVFDQHGSPSDEDWPAHRVRLSDYYLQETEVTNGEMDAYFRAHNVAKARRPARFQKAWDEIQYAGLDPAPYPAVGVSHELAGKYAAWVGGTLPTEAQWEFAARSRGLARRFVWEGNDTPNSANANIDSLGENKVQTQPPRTFKKDVTQQGVCDLTGNVREWCRDRWATYRLSDGPALDPMGPDTRDAGPLDYVIRGGSFHTFGIDFRTTRPRRAGDDEPTGQQLLKDGTADDLGFRVVIAWPRHP